MGETLLAKDRGRWPAVRCTSLSRFLNALEWQTKRAGTASRNFGLLDTVRISEYAARLIVSVVAALSIIGRRSSKIPPIENSVLTARRSGVRGTLTI
jgi:hypothetical protein